MSIPADHLASWNELACKPHESQAIWFLNAFWNGGVKEKGEDVWSWTDKFANIDPNNGGNGYDLDEFWSHKFLEDLGETITVVELRKKLSEIDVDKNKRMCLSEYLLFKFKKSVVDLVTAPQGDPEELEKAQRLVDEASKALDAVLEKLEIQKAALAQAQADENLAVAAEDEAKAALADLQREEQAYQDKIAELTKKSEEGGVVQRNRAKNELEQTKAEDPLPLRRAKLNQEAAVRKAEKARKVAEASRAAAEAAKEETEAAAAEATRKRDDALKYLDKVKASGAGAGQVWWMKRGMYEKQKFLPTAKQTMPYPDPTQG